MRTNRLLASTALSTSALLASGAAFGQPVTYNWTGFYVGLNAGGASTRIEHGLSIPAIDDDPFRRFVSNNRDGSFTVGFLAGYNWQFVPNWLVGVEADINYLRASHQSSFAFLNSSEDVVGTQNTRLRWLGTVRGRLGYTWGNTLVYATGGWAFGGVRSNVEASRIDTGVEATFAGSYSATRNGYAVGGGIEHAFTNMLSLRIEYIHFDLGNFTYLVTRVTGATSTSVPDTWFADGRVSGDIVRAALTLKVGPP
jgi:outer membrane immunogenic protein